MPCMTNPKLTPLQKQRQASAVDRLRLAIAAGTVRVKIGAQGAVALDGWTDREGVSDVCALRALASSPELRLALARAEVTCGRKADQRQVAAGVHSHDGGLTWHPGH